MLTRQALGVFIGCVSIFVYSIGLVTFLTLVANRSYIDKTAREEAEKNASLDVEGFKRNLRAKLACALVICWMMLVLSAGLVRAILKKRHKHMVPWMLLMAISIGCNFIYNVVIVFKAKSSAIKFISGMLAIAVQCLILYPIFKLYQDVREENHRLESAGRMRNYPRLLYVT